MKSEFNVSKIIYFHDKIWHFSEWSIYDLEENFMWAPSTRKKFNYLSYLNV